VAFRTQRLYDLRSFIIFWFEALADEYRGCLPSTKIVMGLLGNVSNVLVAANNVVCHSEEFHHFVG
jgi:hypothetical protein